jgi:siroheme synthase-like protein
MGYFPFFVDIAGKEGLIVGGGVVALRKIQKLLPFAPLLTVAAPEILPEIAEIKSLTLLHAPFSEEMLTGKFFVIAATDDVDLNHRISALCRQRGILVNVVDDQAACGFLFPALVQDGPLTVGISTGGASPSAAIYLKEHLSAALPEHFGEILEFLEAQRSCSPRDNSRWFAALFAACLEAGRPLEAGELAHFRAQFFQDKEEAL